MTKIWKGPREEIGLRVLKGEQVAKIAKAYSVGVDLVANCAMDVLQTVPGYSHSEYLEILGLPGLGRKKSVVEYYSQLMIRNARK